MVSELYARIYLQCSYRIRRPVNNNAFRTQQGIKNCQIADIPDEVDSQITKICTLDLRTDTILNGIILISTFSGVCAVSKLVTVITMK